ncbi:MAG: hypothetical protein HOE14_11975 [Gemmatimonadales bacterium]|jgi:hypothetical protein|nr:hypothetical protein [Gemmatimonadales bacterium]
MTRPTNYLEGQSAADFAPQWIWCDTEQRSVFFKGLPETNETCSCCAEKGDDNYWGLSWDEENACSPSHNATGTLAKKCAERMAAENNSYEYFDLDEDLPPE